MFCSLGTNSEIYKGTAAPYYFHSILLQSFICLFIAIDTSYFDLSLNSYLTSDTFRINTSISSPRTVCTRRNHWYWIATLQIDIMASTSRQAIAANYEDYSIYVLLSSRGALPGFHWGIFIPTTTPAGHVWHATNREGGWKQTWPKTFRQRPIFYEPGVGL